MLKASEDKTFPGAIVASLASPWGQAISAGDPANTYFGSYREVFARDLYEAWTGLLADGDLATARDATLFLFERQQLPDGSMPRNSLVNGKTAPGFVRDAARRGGLPDPDGRPARADRRDAVRATTSSPPRTTSSRTARRSASERWEEQSGYSPSTIAAEIAGLVAAADLAQANGDPASAAIWLGVADDMQRSIKGWTVTTNGPLSSRPVLHPAVQERRSERGDLVQRRQRRARRSTSAPSSTPASSSSSGSASCRRPTRTSLARWPIVDATIKTMTPSGPGWHRYNGDGYGDNAQPTAARGRRRGKGTGHLWPVLSAERAEQSLATGDAAGATSLLLGMRSFASGVGLIPEQDWESAASPASPYGTDPTLASIGFANGHAAGSASPLTWSAASFVRLDGRPRREAATSRCRR